MTEEINPSELGAFTNNLPNKEGIKKLINAVEGNTSAIATKQDKLTAGSNIAISDQNVISATDTKYTAGDNIAISDENVISATDTKYTAGTGISISEQNVISASGADGWELCENGVYDTYNDTNHEYIYATLTSYGTLLVFTPANCETISKVTKVHSIGISNADYTYYDIYTNPTDKTQGKINSFIFGIGNSNLADSYTQATTILYDAITGATISSSDINLYIDSSTKEVLKPFVAKLKTDTNNPRFAYFHVSAKDATITYKNIDTSNDKWETVRIIYLTTDDILTIIGGTTKNASVLDLGKKSIYVQNSWSTVKIYRKKLNFPTTP